MKHLQQIELLIANGNLKDAIRLAMDDANQSEKRGLYSHLLKISCNYEFFEKDRTSGTISDENYRLKFAQLTQALVHCIHADPSSFTISPDDNNQELVDILLEKLQYFRVEYNTTADTVRKFELKKRIEETESELSKYK